jgi:hypothetical protein
MTTGAPGTRRAVPPAARRGALLTDWRYTWRPAWRTWRRSRPFAGGLLMLLAGLELLLIPLSGVLSHGAVKLVVYIGIGGVFGVLIGILLITAGVAVWVSPAHRVFYGVAGVVLGIASFPTSNLGGFFICMLLAILGGSLAFAWTPGATALLAAPMPPQAPAVPEATEPLTAEPPTLPDSGALPEFGTLPDSGAQPRAWPLAAIAAPLAVMAGLLTGHAAAPAASAADSRPSQTCILGIICLGGGGSSPSPGTTPTPTYSLPTCLPTALPSPLPTPLPSALASLPTAILKQLEALPQCVASALPKSLPVTVPTAVPGLPVPVPGLSPGTGTKPGTTAPKPKTAAAGGGIVAPAAISVITAGSATMTGFTYQGNAKLPTAAGGTVTMMKFTASSLTLSSAAQTITEAGHTVTVSSPEFAFSGNVVLYATKLSGSLAGIPLTFTPTTISGLLLKVANLITSNGTITFSNVTTDQAIGIADSLTYGPGGLGFSLGLH